MIEEADPPIVKVLGTVELPFDELARLFISAVCRIHDQKTKAMSPKARRLITKKWLNREPVQDIAKDMDCDADTVNLVVFNDLAHQARQAPAPLRPQKGRANP